MERYQLKRQAQEHAIQHYEKGLCITPRQELSHTSDDDIEVAHPVLSAVLPSPPAQQVIHHDMCVVIQAVGGQEDLTAG